MQNKEKMPHEMIDKRLRLESPSAILNEALEIAKENIVQALDRIS